MITPFDIEKKEFSRSMRGFNIEEVDSFLDEIIIDMQKLMDDNERLKAKIESLNNDLAQYKKSESSVMNTLESAKKLMNDISQSAERRAEIIIKNAQLDAEVIQRDAKESVSKLTEEGERLRYKVSRFRERYRQLLEDELDQLDGSSEDLFAALEKDFIPASLDESSVEEVKVRKPEMVHTQPQKQDQPQTQVKEPLSRETTMVQIERKPSMSDTVVINDRNLEEILREDFGLDDTNATKKAVKEDLTKTRIF